MYDPPADLLALIEANSNLTDVGRRLLDHDLYWAHQVNHKKSQTGLVRRDVVSPVFITGTGRTASSFLHAQMRDVGFRVANVFEATTLARSVHETRGLVSGYETLIWHIDHMIRAGDAASPEYAMVNPHQWNDPAEDIHFDKAVWGTPWWLSHYGGILDWAIGRMFENPVADLEHIKECAELLGHPGDRWCFRATTYLMRLEYLFQVFPDATVIWMERPVEDVIPGLRKMIRGMRLTRSDRVDEDEVAMLADTMARSGPAAAEVTIAEGKVPVDQIIRVSFEDITENTERTLASILDRVALPDLVRPI